MKNSGTTIWRSAVAVTFFSIFVCGCYKSAFESHEAISPLSKIQFASINGRVNELVVFLETNTPLNTIVDTSIFDGVPKRTTVEEAKKQFGDPYLVRPLSEVGSGVLVHLYRVPKGDIGFVTVRLPEETQHQVWAFPTVSAVDKTIINESARNQLLPYLKSNVPVNIRVVRSIGWGGPIIGITTNGVNYVLLGLRDGD